VVAGTPELDGILRSRQELEAPPPGISRRLRSEEYWALGKGALRRAGDEARWQA
jgi:hypothetical protein